jgi:hypothetical protein
LLIVDEDGNGESQIEADHEFLLQLEIRSFCFWNVLSTENLQNKRKSTENVKQKQVNNKNKKSTK